MTHYDYLIVGSGLFGATFAYRAKQAGKTCLVIDQRPQLGGNVYCEDQAVHKIPYPWPRGWGVTQSRSARVLLWDFTVPV